MSELNLVLVSGEIDNLNMLLSSNFKKVKKWTRVNSRFKGKDLLFNNHQISAHKYTREYSTLQAVFSITSEPRRSNL
jgi:hypothetical protein